MASIRPAGVQLLIEKLQQTDNQLPADLTGLFPFTAGAHP
jgi:hypothetical protein